jgi:nitrile hydratase accessory protein
VNAPENLPHGAPASADEPVFAEPWEAQAFALVVASVERGLFTWPDWTAALSRVIAAHGGETGSGRLSEASSGRYYANWLVAFEHLLAERGVTAPGEVGAAAAAWGRAAEATPHGQPLRFENDPARKVSHHVAAGDGF